MSKQSKTTFLVSFFLRSRIHVDRYEWYAFPRLKKVQGKKKRDTAARDAVQAAITQTAEREIENKSSKEATDLLSGKDEDGIF